MCLILFAWQCHDAFPLALAANRDEFHRRPTLPLARWRETPDICGGRDLEAGGGWLACHGDGRFAAVTNVRQAAASRPDPQSRGRLIAGYLQGSLAPAAFAATIAGDDYDGFNLLLGDRRELHYLSNRNGVQAQKLPPGIYGLSNHCLDTPWPKVVTGKAAFAAALPALPAPDAFFRLLADRDIAADRDLPATGVPLAWERILSAIFIVSPEYGTRASTLMLRDNDAHWRMTERSFGPDGEILGESAIP
jgi:uncharacterized protein with NRDE domain